jgi:predicted transcriptional regulator
MNGDGLVELLLRRHDLLRELAEEPRERHLLADAVPDSKSTVYKGVTQLSEAGLIAERTDGLTPTLRGRLALARYGELAAVADLDLLDGIPGEAVDPDALVGAEVVRPDETDAERHLDALWSLLDDATAVEGLAPVVSPGYVERFGEYVTGGLRAELVLPTDLATHLRDEQAPALERFAEADVRLYETTEELPFGLLVVDSPGGQTVAIELREGGLVTGLVLNDTPDAIRWARATIERYRQDAERFL